MVKSQVNMLVSDIGHMPLLYVWRDSGVTQKHGFDMTVHITAQDLPDQPRIGFRDRAEKVLDGTYDFMSGLHHETYIYRGRGDKRFVYLAQAQNHWAFHTVARQDIKTVKDLEDKPFLVNSYTPCVFGNLKHSLQIAGANVDRIAFSEQNSTTGSRSRQAVDIVARADAVAATVDIPFDMYAEQLGLHVLDVPALPVIQNTTICANREWVVRNEETAMAFLRSMVEAIHFFKTEKSRTCEILERTLAPMIEIDWAGGVEHLQEGWSHLLSSKPYPHPLAVWNVYDLDVGHDPKANFIGPFEIWDTSFLRTIDDDGFIDNLYGSQRAAANPPVNAVI